MAHFTNNMTPSLPGNISTAWVSSDNDTQPDYAENSKFLRLITFSITVVGCLDNFALLLVIICHKAMHNMMNIYLANLAVADIILLILGAIGIVSDILAFLPRNLVGCFYIVLTTVPYYSSMSMVSVMTVDRFYAICHPLKHRVMSCKRRSVTLAIAVWCFGLLYSSLVNLESVLLGNGCQVLRGGPNSANQRNETNQSQTVIFSDILKPLPFILLLFVNSLLYLKIIKKLRRSSHFRPSVPTWFRNIRRSRIRITRMLAVNTFVFFTCNTPRTVLLLLNYVQSIRRTEHFQSETMIIISSALLLLNSGVNPLIYNLTNKKYRQAFSEVFFPCKCRSKSTSRREDKQINLQNSSAVFASEDPTGSSTHQLE